MFTKILIANRGEIACRIIRTCQRLGIKTVAIYSTVDQEALHVKMADEAYLVGEAPPHDSYLNMGNILDAAETSGAQAIHPGYGFLSENAEFARLCEETGICFIGPDPDVMEKMGDKMRSRKLARKAGLPILPGTDEAVANENASTKAWELGFPLMVKAADGGGGIGIHIIENQEELMPLIDRTRQIAESAFGSSRLFFERYLKDASHIEVQLLGDKHGNLVHLHERDCSVQRRNQKLVEETPSSEKLTPRLRRRVSSLATKLGKFIGYTSLGTVEFLVSADGSVFFLEMNTRLQVEHGVTELVTGLDLVELQIQAAAGETLPISQEDVSINGHAIEVRVYPEDPKTFMPDAGDITDLHQPEGEFIRIDSALCNNYTVQLDYEPLMAKIMAWGKDRDQAIKTLQRALLEFRVEGVKCNVPLLRDILATKEFVAATYHTGSMPIWLEEFQIRAQNKCSNGKMHKNGNGHKSGNANDAKNGHKTVHENGEREIAAAIGVSLAMTMKSAQPVSLAPFSPWRVYGRREQLLSRTLGNRGWQ
ncbi:MAG: biotin carboxylase N-terminal domain-containing protein [Chloroflexota bacterium]|nr:biotin carboxylase N-terminal domain-containing protein [Chloroflexota bacterium]